TISDPLSRADANNWELAAGYCYFQNGRYVVEEDSSGFRTQCRLLSPAFHDFALQANMQLAEGDLAGFAFYVSGQDKLNVGYRVVIGADGAWSLNAASGTAPIPLHTGVDSGFKTGYGQTNTLLVIVRAGFTYCFVNGAYIGGSGINSTDSGLLGFYVFDNAQPTEAGFSDARIWSL
ncbi:MAG: hypothetical protein ACRDHE_05275, partial [Ktedonobacterales bacterium]